jgi:hypothetical protein
MSLEQFRPIEGYEHYLVTTWGKVYRVDRSTQILSRDKDSYEVSTRKLTELATEETPKGYLRVYLYKNGKRKHHKIHRLVAKAFIPNPNNKPQVNHKDGNKKNNSITNLEWVTDEENKLHRESINGQHTPYK